LAKPAPRGHRAKGSGISGLTLFRGLESAALAQGIMIRTQTQVQRLVFSPTGRVVGLEGRSMPHGSRWAAIHRRLSKIHAKATAYAPPLASQLAALLERLRDRHARPYRMRVHKSVILAAGGFIFNRGMVATHAPLYLRCLPPGTAGDDGAGIRLGESAGGATARMERISAWSFYVPPEALIQGVLVNRKGERICNEELYGATQAGLIAAHGGDAYLVFDSRTRSQGLRPLRSQAAPFQWLYMLPAFFLGRKKERSVASLARALGMAPAQLQATVNAYNAAAERGELDRLGKSPKRFVAQDNPPFYAIDCSLDWKRGVPCSAMTLGGLIVDEETGQVLRADGSAIKGLFAAGRDAVGVCSESYVSGLSIADCVFSGRRAGRHAALLSGGGPNAAPVEVGELTEGES
jgi:3-oxo-5alpha-steroid 4-dehydrogenase